MDFEQGTGPVRHLDQGEWLARFADRILVVCPGCGGRADVAERPGLPALRYYSELLFRPRRLTCAACGANAEWKAAVRGGGLVAAQLGGTEDPFFLRPLWLQTRCASRVLWAYNVAHVDALAGYIRATLREGGTGATRAMFPRLPRWMKESRHRAEVLAGLERLRTLAERPAPAHRSDAAHERGDHARPYGARYFRGGPY
ncbi:hypothetical protein FB563_1604 [Streptomyces puniciscabiei]|uniref:Uncharacterized protein n=1 Tax=Streptomyces puniciscabiei TaxID=164348 RepID=A0A542UC66_9ACTN|nr:hypothetical protein [Streptomyces puniciscabiei]TQK96657.1 hypothetical protein FB563_1604 [Streptomyces puniciscabiei]